MARYRLSTDILSPINSDISLNDGSAFSFGSLPGTPDNDKDFKSLISKNITKDSDILCANAMKKSANAFDVITNDIKKLSNINILSPVNSDISLKDICALSFGSLSGTPGNDKDNESPICKNIRKDSDILCAKAMKESSNAFDVITNDIKKQSNINAKKEGRFKESYKLITQSVDDLFYSKASNPSFVSPALKNVELDNFDQALKVDFKINKNKNSVTSENPKTASDGSENNSNISSKKHGRNKQECSALIGQQKTHHQPKRSGILKGSENGKIKSKVTIGKKCCSNSLDVHMNEALLDKHKAKCSKVASTSTRTNKSLESKSTTSKNSSEKNEGKVARNVQKYKFKSQKKIPVSNTMPATEEKSQSLEKSIQITVSMEMDSIRNFLLDQNMNYCKELLKLQEVAKKQKEVTGYLFSVIDDLLETHKKLLLRNK